MIRSDDRFNTPKLLFLPTAKRKEIGGLETTMIEGGRVSNCSTLIMRSIHILAPGSGCSEPQCFLTWWGTYAGVLKPEIDASNIRPVRSTTKTYVYCCSVGPVESRETIELRCAC